MRYGELPLKSGAEAVESINKYIATQTDVRMETYTDENGVLRTRQITTPRYTGPGDLVTKFMIKNLIEPIMAQFPPASLKAKLDQAKAAVEEAEAAKQQAAASILQPANP